MLFRLRKQLQRCQDFTISLGRVGYRHNSHTECRQIWKKPGAMIIPGRANHGGHSLTAPQCHTSQHFKGNRQAQGWERWQVPGPVFLPTFSQGVGYIQKELITALANQPPLRTTSWSSSPDLALRTAPTSCSTLQAFTTCRHQSRLLVGHVCSLDDGGWGFRLPVVEGAGPPSGLGRRAISYSDVPLRAGTQINKTPSVIEYLVSSSVP